MTASRFPRPASFLLALLFASASAAPAPPPGDRGPFRLEFGPHGVTGLKRAGDAFDTDYIARGRTLGEVAVTYRMERGRWQTVASPRMADRADEPAGGAPAGGHRAVYYDKYHLYNGDFNDHYADLEVEVAFVPSGNALLWTVRLRNLADQPLTVGDLILPLPFNVSPLWDKEEMYERRLVPHVFVSGRGSFAFWQRPNGVGPFLVMTPVAAPPAGVRAEGFRPAGLEYRDDRGVYLHARAAVEEAVRNGGSWRGPLSDLVLAAKSAPGSEAAYAFKFRWADGYDAVRDVLFEEGGFDVHVVPGMTVPSDLEARFAVRSRAPVTAVTAEFPDRTDVEPLGERPGGYRLFRARFRRLGENALTVRAASGASTRLEFFVTEPLETLIRKRSAHLALRQQHRDPRLWYDGLISEFDLRSGTLRSPDDLDGLKDFWVACDDPGLCKAPYIAAKNVAFPDPREIEAVEYYVRRHLWGRLQRTDRERWPFGLYGIPNWKVHRESGPADRDAWVGHLWRLADYPHVIQLYLALSRAAAYYPGMVRELDRDGYLDRAFGTARAYFTVPLETGNWSAIEICRQGEMIIGPLIDELEAAGKRGAAGWLRAKWEEKVEHFVNDRPNLLQAEYPGNPCAFESSQALGRYAMARAGRPGSTLRVRPEAARDFLDEQMRLNIALRGWLEPGYSLLGISRPGTGFYMSHMAGWAVLDYALLHAPDPERLLRLGYASYLGNWMLMNSGPAETGYGYWFPGEANDGGAGGAYVSTALGEVQGKASARGAWYYGGEADMGFLAALRAAATVAVDDPLFGPFAYGGERTETPRGIAVVPRDGLRQRFHAILGPLRLHLELDRDGFAAGRPIEVGRDGGLVRFTLESRFPARHSARLRVSGLAPGAYELLAEGRTEARFRISAGAESVVPLTVRGADPATIELRRVAERTGRRP